MSQSHLEHRKYLERELRNAGIKSEVQRTEGGHMRIVFEAGGKQQSITTSWTPSDHRSSLNARACIRKILRDTGALDKVAPVGKLTKALSIPEPTEPFSERIMRLENDVAMLLDMLATVAEKSGVDLEPPPPPPTPEPVVEPVVKVKTGNYRVPTYGPTQSKMHGLLLSIGFDWTPVTLIRSREPNRSPGAISVALDKLQKKGLVENGVRGMWRKTPLALTLDTSVVLDALQPASAPTPTPAAWQPRRTLLDCLEYQYLPLAEIARRIGYGGPRLASALTYQKRLGLVQSGMRGMWRKVAKQSNGAAPYTNGKGPHAAAG